MMTKLSSGLRSDQFCTVNKAYVPIIEKLDTVIKSEPEQAQAVGPDLNSFTEDAKAL
jgi:hypothetical protein